jgi:hypothetical protein
LPSPPILPSERLHFFDALSVQHSANPFFNSPPMFVPLHCFDLLQCFLALNASLCLSYHSAPVPHHHHLFFWHLFGPMSPTLHSQVVMLSHVTMLYNRLLQHLLPFKCSILSTFALIGRFFFQSQTSRPFSPQSEPIDHDPMVLSCHILCPCWLRTVKI